MQHSVAGVRTAPQGIAVRALREGDRGGRGNLQARTPVTGQRCVRCQDVASTLVAPGASMMRLKQQKIAATRADANTGLAKHAYPFSMVGNPLPTSYRPD